MKDLEKVIRVGTDFYKKIEIPLTNDTLKILKKWNRTTIIDDYGKNSLAKIKKYEAFCTLPSHNDFKPIINNCFNRYEPLSYETKLSNEDKYNNTIIFLKHIFGKQFDLGLDYLTILWQKPTQVLPVLCLVSKEKNTGKTTFINFLKSIFEANATINTNEDFRSRFNSDWSGKLIIAVDEVLLDKKEDSERIKNLSTSKYYKIESKGKDKEEQEFFGKFVLCSNNEENFIKTDTYEIRYWVRKIKPLDVEFLDVDLQNKLKEELPYFTHFLKTRSILTPCTTRMWFNEEQIHTNALEKLIHGNKTSIEREIEELLIEEFESSSQEELCYTTKNIVEMLKRNNIIVQNSYVTKLIKEKFNLTPQNSSYKFFRSDFNISEYPESNYSSEKGRFYTFKKNDILKSVEMLNDE